MGNRNEPGAASRPPSRRGRRLAAILGGVAGAALLLVGLVPAAWGTTVIDLTTAGASETYNGAIFRQGPLPTSAGTGVLNPFLRVSNGGQDPAIEQGYNTDYRPLQYNEDSSWTHSLLLSSVPLTTVDGVQYRKFNLDINQVKSTPLLSLDKLKLYLAPIANLHNYDPALDTFDGVHIAPAWDLGDAWVKMDYTLAPGSGVSDVSFLVPETVFASATGCGYGQPACGTYLYVYNQFGSEYANNDGFEEWSTEVEPFVQPSKTASGSYDRTYSWTISKSASPLTHDLFAGDSETSSYTVSVDRTTTDGSISVSGNITIAVPKDLPGTTTNAADAYVRSVTDTFAGQTVDATCPGGLPQTVKAGQSLVCTYTLSYATLPANGTNTATITIDGNDTPFTATAPVTFTEHSVGYPTVHVTDNFNGSETSLGSVSDDTSFTSYTHSFACSSDPADYTNGTYSYTRSNTATITETSQTASRTVTTNCYAPVVSKTAAGTYDNHHHWDVTKSVDPTSQDAFAGDSAPYTWTVTVTDTPTEENFAVAGTITVVNPNPSATMTVSLADVLNDGAATAGSISGCTGTGVTYASGSLSIPAGGTASCAYSASPTGRTATLNTATATLNSIAFTGTHAVAWTATQIDPSVTLDDDQNPDLPTTLTAGGTFTYHDSYTCSSTAADYAGDGTYAFTDTNTATLTSGTTTLDDASASTTVNCYAPVVSKTAAGSFDRDWSWTIDKSGDQTSLTLSMGQQFLVNYSVVVNATKVDGNYVVAGTISVHNPHPSASMTVSVADAIGATAAVIDCGGGAGDTSLTVAAGATGTCSYTVDFGATKPSETSNTATVTFNSIAFAASHSFGWSLANETDECIAVSDDKVGSLGTVCAVDAPKTFTYSTFVGPYETCGPYVFTNTASFVTNDTDTTGSNDWTISVSVPCPGCTLTQGYWKTHSEQGPAPYDDAWALLDALEKLSAGPPAVWGGDGLFERSLELFFSPMTNQTWYQVFWTSPQGNAYYNLAHQYMAAKLNILNGASAPPSVTSAISAAEALFEQYTPADIGKLKGNKAPRPTFISLAGTLAAYNEGKLGVPHCSEDALSSTTQ